MDLQPDKTLIGIIDTYASAVKMNELLVTAAEDTSSVRSFTSLNEAMGSIHSNVTRGVFKIFLSYIIDLFHPGLSPDDKNSLYAVCMAHYFENLNRYVTK